MIAFFVDQQILFIATSLLRSVRRRYNDRAGRCNRNMYKRALGSQQKNWQSGNIDLQYIPPIILCY
jgi:hypothetical protein